MCTPGRSCGLEALHTDLLNSCWHQFQAQLIEPHQLRYRNQSADIAADEADGEALDEEN